ncbi:xanthine dehydrogenase family protein subunit M [Variovorax sp. KK3]|uniref:FAD binding domain-containing protein n=1 Tax=Variovorax sp. KK3 TaxID=1855728 RepID=UPI00097BE56C|nr:xanthine dehydrogenase family protein subunit M [Variovorax sp. KK3]
MQAFRYMRATSVDMAVSAFSASGGNARYVAGGTTLYDLMKLGVEKPTRLIDLTAVRGLDTITTDGNALRFGAMVSMADVARVREVRRDYPVLAESLLKAASQQLRNMATVGGNLLQRTRCLYFRAGPGVYPCNKRQPGAGCAAIEGMDRGQAVLGTSGACTAAAAGDWPVALIALDALVEVRGPNGVRTMQVAALYRLPGSTPEREFTLDAGEVITAVIVPKTRMGQASTYHKIRDRESYAFALASAAVALDMEGPTVREARVALGGVGTVPWRARQSEALLRGETLSPERVREASRAAFQDARVGHHNAFKPDLGARVVAEALMIAAARSRA